MQHGRRDGHIGVVDVMHQLLRVLVLDTMCVNRHIAPQKKVVLPSKDLCDLRSSRQFEYAPTRDNMKIEHDACSQHWGRVNGAAGAYPGKGPHIQMILFDEATHRPLGVLVFGGSVCLE